MKILAFDPSSKVCGYAVLSTEPSGLNREQLLDAGLLKPNRQTDSANERIRTITREAMSLANEVQPDFVVIEDTTGKVSSRHGGGGAGLAIYGKAIGWLAATMLIARPDKVHLILENLWTGGQKKKHRQICVAQMFKTYKIESDPGGDVSDAIGVGLWFSRRHGDFTAQLKDEGAEHGKPQKVQKKARASRPVVRAGIQPEGASPFDRLLLSVDRPDVRQLRRPQA